MASVDGQPVAATFLNSYEDPLVPLMIEAEPGHPAAEAAAAASMAAMLRSVSPRPVEFEGHVDEDVYMRVLGTSPHRSVGPLTPMDLVQVTRAVNRPTSSSPAPRPARVRARPGGAAERVVE